MADISNNISIKNRKASFNFHFLEEFEAGVALMGSEIKSIRSGRVSLQEAFCVFHKNELWIKNLHIAAYEQSGHYGHEPFRLRKLLLHKKELNKLQEKLGDQGLTLIPTKLYINKRGLCKIRVALAKGKKLYDKRQDIKKKDMKREIDRSGF